MVAMDDTGGVRAMVGGRDYDVSQFNRVTQAHRQPGSSFKYFIYLAAMENGLTPWSVREDAPITIHIAGQPDWTPSNYHDEFKGPVSLVSAFAQSLNMVAIRVANEVGGQNVIEVARRYRLPCRMHPFTRCLTCNGALNSLAHAVAAPRVPPRIAAKHSAFFECRACSRVFWEGSHHAQMRGVVEQLRQLVFDEPSDRALAKANP